MKHSFTLLTFVMMFSLMTVNGQNRYSVNLAEAGTLRQQILDLGADRIEALTISGPVNGVDLTYLNSATGIIAGITSLDLSGVTLAADETEYNRCARSRNGYDLRLHLLSVRQSARRERAKLSHGNTPQVLSQ